jgi:hypothetical protein
VAHISLRGFSRVLGSGTVSVMARKAGLTWPPPPPVSVRNLANLAGLPLQPTNLRLAWQVGTVIKSDNPPDSEGVNWASGLTLSWRDAARDADVDDPRVAIRWHLALRDIFNGIDYSSDPIVSTAVITRILAHDAKHSWNVVPFNQFGEGPGSPVFTFTTQGLPQQPPPPSTTPLPPTPPTISVSHTGTDSSTVFTVTGSGFSPKTTVTIRIVDDSAYSQTFQQSSDSLGNLNFQKSFPSCKGNSGYVLHFSATDNRPDKTNATGELWSNTFTTSCP